MEPWTSSRNLRNITETAIKIFVAAIQLCPLFLPLFYSFLTISGETENNYFALICSILKAKFGDDP